MEDDLKKEIVNLKIRLKRIEELLLNFPNVEDYLSREFGEEELYEEAEKLVTTFDTASASFLQRKFNIGYSRAARLLDLLEEKGIVGAANGSEPREVLKRTKV